MGYPVKRENRSLSKRNNNNSVLPLNTGGIPNIFNHDTSNYAMRDGRVHCQSVERTAIYTDANGNRVVLKENAVTMNTDKDGPGLSYTVKGKGFHKKSRNCHR